MPFISGAPKIYLQTLMITYFKQWLWGALLWVSAYKKSVSGYAELLTYAHIIHAYYSWVLHKSFP